MSESGDISPIALFLIPSEEVIFKLGEGECTENSEKLNDVPEWQFG